MRLTASSNVEDLHDALSSTVDCASTSNDKNVISTQITKLKRKAEERDSDMLTSDKSMSLTVNSALAVTASPTV